MSGGRGVRIIVTGAVLGVALSPLAAGESAAATGSFSYVLRGDVAGEFFDPADGECIPFDGTLMKIVNDTDRTLHLTRSCDAADDAGQVAPGDTYVPAAGSAPAFAVTPLEPDDPRHAPVEPPPPPEDASPLPEISLV